MNAANSRRIRLVVLSLLGTIHGFLQGLGLGFGRVYCSRNFILNLE
jgi:hypothetical protein